MLASRLWIAIALQIVCVSGALAQAPGAPAEAPAPPAENAPVDPWDKPTEESPAANTPVAYTPVDNATFRVFAIGPVGLGTFELHGRTINFAITASGHGTGFAVSADGLILTAQHVVSDAHHVVVRHPGKGGFSAARVVYESPDDDIAVLRVERTLEPLVLDASAAALRVRQTAFAVGYPLDATRSFAQSARGIIAGHLDDGTVQLDMDVNPGNSGGPLLDERDRVIGMIVARADVQQGAQGIGYAVPVRKLVQATRLAAQLVRDGRVRRLSPQQHRSAVVVDELIQGGALRRMSGTSDLKQTMSLRLIEEAIDRVGEGVDDADLLAYIAANLWNASLVLRYGEVTEVGGTQMMPEQTQRLGRRLQGVASTLSHRALELDPSIAERSKFVVVAERAHLHRNASPRVDDDSRSYGPPRRAGTGFFAGASVGVGFGSGAHWSVAAPECPSCGDPLSGFALRATVGHHLSEALGLVLDVSLISKSREIDVDDLVSVAVGAWTVAGGLQLWNQSRRASLLAAAGLVGVDGTIVFQERDGGGDLRRYEARPGVVVGGDYLVTQRDGFGIGIEARAEATVIDGEPIARIMMGVSFNLFQTSRAVLE